jgi:hypothetical protein
MKTSTCVFALLVRVSVVPETVSLDWDATIFPPERSDYIATRMNRQRHYGILFAV